MVNRFVTFQIPTVCTPWRRVVTKLGPLQRTSFTQFIWTNESYFSIFIVKYLYACYELKELNLWAVIGGKWTLGPSYRADSFPFRPRPVITATLLSLSLPTCSSLHSPCPPACPHWVFEKSVGKEWNWRGKRNTGHSYMMFPRFQKCNFNPNSITANFHYIET